MVTDMFWLRWVAMFLKTGRARLKPVPTSTTWWVFLTLSRLCRWC